MNLKTFAAVSLAAAFSLPTASVWATPGAPSPSASCLGTITAYETQNDPFTGDPTHGFVGPWISGNATATPGTVATFNSQLARDHGTVASCVPD